MQRQYLKRQCDAPGCGRSFQFPMDVLTPADSAELSNWTCLTKEHTLVDGQPPQPLIRHGCSATCATEIIRNGLLELPKKVSTAN